MERVNGSAGVLPVECVNVRKDKWRVRWDVQTGEDGAVNYMEQEFDHRPTIDEIRQLIIGWHNAQIDERILSGFRWRDMPVWLSSENQFNYKAAYDLAVQTDGATLPVVFKFGTDDTPVYHQFDTVDELREFYMAAMEFVTRTLGDGWKQKDTLDWTAYNE